MGIGLDMAIQAQERVKQNKAVDKAYGTEQESKGEYFSPEQDEALQRLTDENINNPLHWTQHEKALPQADEKVVKEFMDTGIKTADDYFK